MSKDMLGTVVRKLVTVPTETLGVVYDLLEKLSDPEWVDALKKFLRKENPFEIPMDTESQLERWRKLLLDRFNVTFGEVEIPERKPGFDRLIIVPQELTIAHIVKVFHIESKGEVLDYELTENERDATNGAYAIWVRDCVEADEENANKSARDIREEELSTETLMERLLHELVYYSECKKHLDVNNMTLCAGSRRANGFVPAFQGSNFYEKLYLGWTDPRSSFSGLRAREVVS